MIIDSLTRLRSYEGILPHIKEAMDCYEVNAAAAPTRVEFDGGFILFQQGTTAPVDGVGFEAHRRYIDVQVLIEGSETMVWADLDTLQETIPFSAEKDAGFYEGEGTVVHVQPGTFYALFPKDAHKPARHEQVPSTWKKAIIKLCMD